MTLSDKYAPMFYTVGQAELSTGYPRQKNVGKKTCKVFRVRSVYMFNITYKTNNT